MADRPLKIVHCLRAPVGGLFRHVFDLASEQAARGHQVGIIVDAKTGGDAAEVRLAGLAGICRLGVTRLPMGRLPGLGDVLAARRIRHVLAEWRPNVIHGHGAKGGAYARLACGGNGKRSDQIIVYTPHGGSLHYSRASPAGYLYLSAERLMMARTDLFLFESEYGRQAFHDKVGKVGSRSRVVHNGVGPADFVPVAPGPDAADVLFIGELRHLKGVDVLLHALKLLGDADNGPTALVVGAGAARTSLERMAAGLGLGSRIVFAAPMPARKAFARGRCLVVPSRAESLPYIVLEGAAARLPVIATDVGGVSEIFGNQADRLVPPDDPRALSLAIKAVLENPEEARRDAETLAGDVAERFTISGMADAVLKAYGESLGRLP